MIMSMYLFNIQLVWFHITLAFHYVPLTSIINVNISQTTRNSSVVITHINIINCLHIHQKMSKIFYKIKNLLSYCSTGLKIDHILSQLS